MKLKRLCLFMTLTGMRRLEALQEWQKQKKERENTASASDKPQESEQIQNTRRLRSEAEPMKETPRYMRLTESAE